MKKSTKANYALLRYSKPTQIKPPNSRQTQHIQKEITNKRLTQSPTGNPIQNKTILTSILRPTRAKSKASGHACDNLISKALRVWKLSYNFEKFDSANLYIKN